MEHATTTVTVSFTTALDPSQAFAVLVEELATALSGAGMDFQDGTNGRVAEGDFEVGRVVSWNPGKCILFRWHQADWKIDETTEVELRFEPAGGRTRVTLTHDGWGRLIGDSGELAGWCASEVIAPLFRATAPSAFGDWLTERKARRPSGIEARGVYRDPLYHYPNFRVILAEMSLVSEDYLLEVGCGGGAFLREALRSGCCAAAVDHSWDMVRLAQEVNAGAVTEGRLEVRHASADSLPFPDATFTCATMTGVLGFLPNPVVALQEIRRVLREGGRIVVLGSDPKWRGTAAAPEPMASRLRFYTDDELNQLATEAGFEVVQVVWRDLEPFAQEVGIPAEHLPLFAGGGAPFLLARKG